MTKRYEYFPQMEDYDSMASGVIVPFAMLSGPENYNSQNINTDCNGFRYSEYKNELISICDIEKFDEVNILIGGSSVFGVGATSDSSTISSYLSRDTGEVWINLGIRGGVSLSEYIHLIRFVYKAKKVKNIVFFSGINDIYVNQLKENYNNYDNLFNDIPLTVYSCKRIFISYVFSKIYNVNIDTLVNKPIKEIVFYSKYKNQYEDVKVLTSKEKLNLTIENFHRNFMLYSALKKELNCNLVYILQPFVEWTNKELTKEEKIVFKELEEMQKNSKWASHRSKLSKKLYKSFKDSILEIADKMDLTFIDSHSLFTDNKTLFVDAVHLTDKGNEMVSKLIQETI